MQTHIQSFFLALYLTFLPVATAMAEQDGAQAVIFMYHRFGESRYPSTNVTLKQFEEQLEFFETNNFSVLPLEEIVQALKDNSSLPDKSIAITMDDAYLSVYEEAYPRLKARGYPFTVFVATDAVDKEIPAYMSWQQMQEMQEHGTSFGSHSQNHHYMVRKKAGESPEAWTKRMTDDIAAAHKRIEEELGQMVIHFAYPYGEYNLELMDIIKSFGYTGFGQHSGGVNSLNDRRALPRFPVAESYAEMTSFRTKAFSLAMPVVEQQPLNPVTTEKQPELTITLAPSSAGLDQLACYIGARRMKIQWLEPGKRFRIQTANELPQGRSRYNCTAPDSVSSRYFWYSHQWIRPHLQE